MASINQVTLIGRLGKEPEIRMTQSGTKVASFSLATSEKYTNRNGDKVESTEWHNIVVWDKLAEIIEKYFKKGQMAFIQGKLTTRKWQDKDGNDRYTTEIIAHSAQNLSPKDDDAPRSSGQSYQAKDQMNDTYGNVTAAQPKTISDGVPFDDQIPF